MANLEERIGLLKQHSHDTACIEVIDALLAKLYDLQRATKDMVVQAYLSKDVPEREKHKLLDAAWQGVVRSCIDVDG